MDNVQRMTAPINIPKTLIAGVAATAAMTVFILIAPLIGLPHMQVGSLLGGEHKVVGWIVHFAMGIVFAFIYARIANNSLPVENNVARGAIYGLLVFVFAQIVIHIFAITGRLDWDSKENWGLAVFVSSIGHLIYGSVLGAFYKKTRNGDFFQPVKDHR
ncbi:MAG: DUF6789 family protein [Chitinophagales bacterium]